ncbi:MAG: ThuA domain-containing protein [Anaerohalosphaera sp.]|nr:ThuA domain-containing protein [Anaerohalosphaera sp.]
MKNLKQLVLILFLLCVSLGFSERPVVQNPDGKSMSVDKAFESFIVYQDGKSRQPIRFIERSVYLASAKPEQSAEMTSRLLKVLQSTKSTLPAKQLACKWIVLVDDAKAIEVLAAMLDKPDTFEMALGALEQYESHKADGVLSQSLKRFKVEQQTAIINAMGRRGNEFAVDQLATLLESSDAEAAKTAAVNLGIIGNEKAAQRLLQTSNIPKETLHDALLRCALKLKQSNKNNEALKVYRSLWQQKTPVGLVGLVSIEKQNARIELLEAVRSNDPLLVKTAINLSGTLSDSVIDNELIDLLGSVSPEHKIALIRMFADRRKTAACTAIAAELSSNNDDVVAVAVQALGQVGNASSVEPLARAASTKTGDRRRYARQSLVLLDGNKVNSTIRQLIQTGPSSLRAELIQAAMSRKVQLESKDLWRIIKSRTEPKDARKEAINALVETSESGNYQQLVTFWAKLDDMSLSQTIKLAVMKSGSGLDENTRSEPLLKALKDKLSPGIMGQMLSAAGGFDHKDFLGIMQASLQDPNPAVQLEAVRALVSWPDNKGIDELTKVSSTSSAATQRILAQRALLARGDSKKLSVQQRIGILKSLVASDAADNIKEQAASLYQQLKQQLPEYRIEQVAEVAPKGYRLTAYLNCGTDIITGGDHELKLKLKKGRKHRWAGSEKKLPATAGTIFFDEKEIVFEVTGLKNDHSYQLGFVWFDYDNNKRVQKVQVDNRTLVPATKLPVGYSKGKPLKNITVPIPAGLTADGKCVVRFEKLAALNAVVSEIWLYESLEANKKMSSSEKRILLVTGEDYPGHKWQETAPVVHSLLEKDSGLNVDVLDDLSKLAAADLLQYDAVVMHFKNYDPKVPGRDGYDNLSKYVQGGGGLVLVHFACGAFQEFKDEFTVLAGRAWNPKLRGHDPHGKFTVNIIDHEHPITKGLEDFETIDELYTCLDGNTEIKVLAESVSKVDKKKYPIAFVLNYGKGRVFHSVLGHDVVAFEANGVGELFRRGTVWAAN